MKYAVCQSSIKEFIIIVKHVHVWYEEHNVPSLAIKFNTVNLACHGFERKTMFYPDFKKPISIFLVSFKSVCINMYTGVVKPNWQYG